MTTLIDLDQERARFEAETARQERRLLSKLDTASQEQLSHTFPLWIFPERVQDLIGAVATSLEMTKRTVIWVASAERELGEIWFACGHSPKVNQASYQIDRDLRADALRNTDPLSEGLQVI